MSASVTDYVSFRGATADSWKTCEASPSQGGTCAPLPAQVVIEQLLEGPEVSVFALTDGEHVLCLPPAQDYKRALDGDKGLNTGGAPAERARLTSAREKKVTKIVIRIMVRTMRNCAHL